MQTTFSFALSPKQRQVWSMEERYWQVLKAMDRKSYVALWDEDFVGWPYPLSAPIGKEPIRANPFSLLAGKELTDVHSKPEAIQVFEDIAVVFYTVTLTYTELGRSVVEGLRIAHTWRRKRGAWLIISGMSAPNPAQK